MLLYADGGVRGRNPGRAVYWSMGCQTGDDFTIIVAEKESDAYTTNNAAEYLAVMEALDFAYEYKDFTLGIVHIHSDSKVIVEQMNGNYSIGHALKDLNALARFKLERLASAGIEVHFMWVPRKEMVRRLGH